MEFDINGSHVHECKDREDDVCGPRGYCVCECGATRRWYNNERLMPPLDSPFTTEEWKEPTDVLTSPLAGASMLFDSELGCVREFRETGVLPWWVYRSPYDQMRARGVAVVLLGWDIEMATVFDRPRHERKWPDFRARRPYACWIPRAHRYHFMLRKALAFMDGYYSADIQRQREQHLDESYYWRCTIAPYEMVKWYILDGDGFDDENYEGGDYILACRIALHETAARYPGLRDADFPST